MHWFATHPARFSVGFQVSRDGHGLSGYDNQCGEGSSGMSLAGLAVAGHHRHRFGIGRVLNLPAKTLSRHVWHGVPLHLIVWIISISVSLRNPSREVWAWQSPSETK